MYLYQQQDFMHNKRFFSPEIRTSYSFNIATAIDSKRVEKYIYARKAENDRAYEFSVLEKKCKNCTKCVKKVEHTKHSVCTKLNKCATCSKRSNSTKTIEYTSEYHRTLIQMFPSCAGNLAIDVDREGAFTSFLRESLVEKHEHYILAALLLLSEGVDVPLEWESDKHTNRRLLALRKTHSVVHEQKPKKGKLILSVPINMRIADKRNKVEYTEAKKVIDFFIAYKNKERIQEPSSIQEYESGEFLNTPQFLIQSYIYELIDTAPRAQKFIDAVHKILNNRKMELANKKKKPQKDMERVNQVFNRCFKSTDSVTEEQTVYLDILKKIKQITDSDLFPFAHPDQLPHHIYVPCYDPKHSPEFDNDEKFSNCVEIALYTLFCCLAYDPKDHIYYTEHMPWVSYNLEQFFMKNRIPVKVTSDDIHITWNRVVSQLESKHIVYKRADARNELQAGLLNMLLVITEVTCGADSDTHKEVVRFMQDVQEQDVDGESVCAKVQDWVETLLISLSRNKNLEVSCENLRIEERRDNTQDISATITLKYRFGSKEYSLKLQCTQKYIYLTLYCPDINYSSEDKKMLLEAKSVSKKKKTFMGHVLRHYIDKIIQRSTESSNLALKAREIAENYPTEINRILLLNKIESNDYKICLIIDYLSCAKEKGIKLHEKSAIVRFTSNILGSVDLTNIKLAKSFLSILVYTGANKSMYQNLHVSKTQYRTIAKPDEFNVDLIDFLTSEKLTCALVYILKIFITPSKTRHIKETPFGNWAIIEETFNCLFESNNMDLADQIPQAYEKNYPEEGATMAGLIRIAWFIVACERKKKHPKLIESLFEAIDIRTIFGEPDLSKTESEIEDIKSGYAYLYSFVLLTMISDWNEFKESLTRNKEHIEKFNYLEQLLRI